MNSRGFTPGSVLAKNSLLNLMGMIIPPVVGIVAIPFAIRGLTTDGFGILSIVWIFLGYLGILDFGISRASTKFAAESLSKRDNGFSSVFWISLRLNFLFGIAGALIILLTKDFLITNILNVPDLYVKETELSFIYLGIALPFILLSLSMKGILGAAQRFDLVNFVYVPTTVVSLLIPAMSYFFKYDLSTVVLLIIVTRICAALVYFYICIKIFRTRLFPVRIETPALKKMMIYGGWVTVSGIISPLLVYMDRIFIGAFLSMSDVSFYSAPFEAIYRLRIISIALMTTFFPEFSALGSQNNRTAILMSRSIKIILISTGVASILLFFFSRDILSLWLGKSFMHQSTTIFRIFSIGIAINALAYVPFTVFQGTGRPDLPAKFHILEFPVYIVLLFVGIKLFGIKGAAVAWMVRIILDFSLLYYKFYPNILSTLKRERIGLELVMLFFLGCTLFINNKIFSSLGMRSLVGLMVVVVFFWVAWNRLAGNSEKELLRSLIKRREG